MDNKQLIEGLKKGDKKSYELLYKNYYVFLCLIAEHIIHDTADSEEIVSDVFVKLWNTRTELNITGNIKSYLCRAVQNTAINYLEKNKSKGKITSLDSLNQSLLAWDDNYPLGNLYEEELILIIEKGIKMLPDGCREIFLLSRNQELTYTEIATHLGISVNTVKTQMKIAIARLREELKDYLNLIVTLFILKNL